MTQLEKANEEDKEKRYRASLETYLEILKNPKLNKTAEKAKKIRLMKNDSVEDIINKIVSIESEALPIRGRSVFLREGMFQKNDGGPYPFISRNINLNGVRIEFARRELSGEERMGMQGKESYNISVSVNGRKDELIANDYTETPKVIKEY